MEQALISELRAAPDPRVGEKRPPWGAGRALPGGARRAIPLILLSCMGTAAASQSSDIVPMDQFIVRAIPGLNGAETDILENDKIAFTYLSIRVDDDEMRAAAELWCSQFDAKARLVSDVKVGRSYWLLERRQTTFDCTRVN